MAAIGILYLVFEDYIIEQLPSTKQEEKVTGQPLVSRAVFGAQVSIVNGIALLKLTCKSDRLGDTLHDSHKI